MIARRLQIRLEALEQAILPARSLDRDGLRRRRHELRSRAGTLNRWQEAEKVALDATFLEEDREQARRHDLMEKKFLADRRGGPPLTDREVRDLVEFERRYAGIEDPVVWAAHCEAQPWPTDEERKQIEGWVYREPSSDRVGHCPEVDAIWEKLKRRGSVREKD